MHSVRIVRGQARRRDALSHKTLTRPAEGALEAVVLDRQQRSLLVLVTNVGAASEPVN